MLTITTWASFDWGKLEGSNQGEVQKQDLTCTYPSLLFVFLVLRLDALPHHSLFLCSVVEEHLEA